MENSDTLDKTQIPPDEATKEGFIPFLEGRPKRDAVINGEDILNLKIALNTAKNLEEFVSLV